MKYNSNVYEKKDIMIESLTPLERERIENTIEMVPKEVKSIIDIGCGDGRIINILSQKYEDTVGVDYSETLLKKVKTKTIKSSCHHINVGDNSYDLVICCEVLEHLPDEIFRQTINELKRISRKYILISTPYQENLRLRYVKCDKCENIFNAWHHLRSFEKSDIVSEFFNEHQLIKSKFVGNEIRVLNKTLKKLSQEIGNDWYYEKGLFCPHCENTNVQKLKRRFLISVPLNRINLLISRLINKKQNYWQVLLFKKQIEQNDTK